MLSILYFCFRFPMPSTFSTLLSTLDIFFMTFAVLNTASYSDSPMDPAATYSTSRTCSNRYRSFAMHMRIYSLHLELAPSREEKKCFERIVKSIQIFKGRAQ